MSFLNAWLLAGGLACVIPLVLHLLNRAVAKKVDWGAFQFLSIATTTSSKRPTPQHWLLLLVRIAIPILLAFCLARPVLTAFRRPLSNIESLAFVLDNSMSMRVKDRTGLSRYDRALSTMQAIAKEYPTAKPVVFLTAATSVTARPASTVRQETRTIDSPQARSPRDLPSEPCDLTNRPFEAINAAREQALRSGATTQRIFVLSDFQSSNWSPSEALQFTDAIRNDSADSPNPLTFVPIAELDAAGEAVMTQSNLSVRLEPQPGQTNVAKQPIQVQAVVHNDGPELRETVATLAIDGQMLESKTILVEPEGLVNVRFAFAVEESGWYTISVKIDADDVLPDDNLGLQVVHVQPRRRALIIAAADDESATYLQTALAPFDEPDRNPFIARIRSWQSVSAKDFEEADLVALIGYTELGPADYRQLEGYVKGGGVAFFFPRHLEDPSHWNDLHLNGLELLPLDYGTVLETSTLSQQPVRVVMPPQANPRFANLRSVITSSLSVITVQRFAPMQVHATIADRTPAPSASVTTYLQLSSGEPLLVGCDAGNGYVVQSGIGLESTWSNLALRPAFVPLVQLLANYSLERNHREHNLGTQRESLLSLDAFAFSTVRPFRRRNSRENESTYELFTQYAGVYGVVHDDGESLYCVMPPENESTDLVTSRPQLRELASRLDAELIGNEQEEQQRRLELTQGRAVWPLVCLTILGCLFAENILAARIPPKEWR